MSLLSSSQAGMVKSQDCDVSQTFVFVLVLCMSLHVHEPPLTQHIHTFQLNFSFYSVHSQKRGFITAAWPQHLTYQPLDFQSQCGLFCVCCHWVLFICGKTGDGVWEACCRLAFVCVRIWVCSCESCPPELCVYMYVCMCTVLLGVYVWCCLSSRSFPTVTPEAALAQRDREREKEGERVPLLSPHAHTLIILS